MSRDEEGLISRPLEENKIIVGDYSNLDPDEMLDFMFWSGL